MLPVPLSQHPLPLGHFKPESVVWISTTFDNNFGIGNDFAKYLRRVVGIVLFNISPSNIFLTSLFLGLL